ncbi:MAG: SdpI family protein [Oscillospiraceae bacterium]|nr:SdpI family protein [Oscillospiraceae bacterium]
MWFWWFMSACNMLCPAAMIVFGRIMQKHCTDSVNPAFGYRTRRSMLNAETWRFANEDCGKRWWKIGWILLPLTVLVQLLLYGKPDETISNASVFICLAGCAVLVLSVIPTERALKQTFTDDGIRKR